MSLDSQTKSTVQKSFHRKKLIHRGNYRCLYEAAEPGMMVLHFEDTLKDCPGLGVINNRIQAILMENLSQMGIETHFSHVINMREQLVKISEPLPFSMKMHTIALGELATALHVNHEGFVLAQPLREYWTKGKDDHYHRIAFEHLQALEWIDEEENDQLALLCGRINDFLQGYFLALHMKLANYNLRFGYNIQQDFWSAPTSLCLLDVINFQKSTVIDIKTGTVMNEKSIFTLKDSVLNGYQEIARRFGVIISDDSPSTRCGDDASTNLLLEP